MSTDGGITSGQIKILQVETDFDTSTDLAAALEDPFELEVESDPADALALLHNTQRRILIRTCLCSRAQLSCATLRIEALNYDPNNLD